MSLSGSEVVLHPFPKVIENDNVAYPCATLPIASFNKLGENSFLITSMEPISVQMAITHWILRGGMLFSTTWDCFRKLWCPSSEIFD